MEEINNEQPANRELSGRNPDGTFRTGVSGNPLGRPAGTMKDYLRRKFMEMTDEEKEVFLKEYKLSGKDMIEFGEGKAHQDTSIQAEHTIKQYVITEGESESLQSSPESETSNS